MTPRSPTPAVPVAVTALWHSQLRALAQDVEWGLSQAAVAGRLRGLLADIDRAEHRALQGRLAEETAA